MRIAQFIAVAWLLLFWAPGASYGAERRVALVVGNAAYRYADKLANPVSDAQAVGGALKKLGFDVVYGEDLDQQSLRDRIGQFAEAVKDADVALVYFAGHGATFSDTPYVVPVDATFKSVERVPYELIPVEMLIGELRRARGIRIAILDACRDNAAERALKRQAGTGRGGEMTRGLAPMKNRDGKNPDGLILAYATQYLSTAADDDAAVPGGLLSWMSSAARHSPFTAALLSNISTPGLDVKEMFYKVGRDVIAATDGKQRPEISISMYDQYFLVPVSRDTQIGVGAVFTAPAKPAAPQQSAALSPVTPAPSALPAPDPMRLTQLKKGLDLLSHGDIPAARLMFKRAADAGDAAAAFSLAETYDPLAPAQERIGSDPTNVGLARTWYAKARDLGSTAAAERLERLEHMPQK